MPGLPCPRPARVVLDGRYARLEPLAAAHAPALLRASSGDGAAASFAYLPAEPPRDLADIERWVSISIASEDRLYFAVIDLASGQAAGRQALMRIDPQHGVIEIGDILWGPAIARTRVATEALYLAARYVFKDLGYRRFEWKCHNKNEASKAAALRFGFLREGLFRQHMWVKGASRDTAWFSMLDSEWPEFRREYKRWLDPANFDSSGKQLSRLNIRR